MIIDDKAAAVALLNTAGVFYYNDSKEGDSAYHCLNMNDTFGWACAYGPFVPDDQLMIVAELFWRYGASGLTYWCTICPEEEDRWSQSQFEDVQRGIDFVRHEEALRTGGLDSTARAFEKVVYTLGRRKKRWWSWT